MVISAVFGKALEKLNLTFFELILLIIMCFMSLWTWQMKEVVEATNATVVNIDQRYYDDIEEKAAAVLTTLQKQHITEPDEILDFLAEKPAGKADLKKGVMTQQTYECLVDIYGDLARNARMAFN